MSQERVAAIPNMGIKGVKNEQFSKPLAGHKWPQKVAIFSKELEKGLTQDVTLPDF